MAAPTKLLTQPYSAYSRGALPEEDRELTHVERGAPCGEYLRRFWQPVALSSELGELPLKVRIFGEELVLFRSKSGDVGLLELHCSHRGTSLEYGICEERGLRCCYHGWLYGVDGRILETPGDPPESTLRFQVCHGAYPAMEYKGLVFGYFGPPEKRPEFPIYDSYEHPGDRLVPYYITYPCNWLQVHENVMDPAHAVFLHTRISFSHFADAWGELPAMEFPQTPTGMVYVTSRRWGDNVWVRSNDILLPNLAQVGHVWEDGSEPKEFSRVAITRWTVPLDNSTCRIIGWRHFHPDADPRGLADESKCGPESVDFFGQGGGPLIRGAPAYPRRLRRPGLAAADRDPRAREPDQVRYRRGAAAALPAPRSAAHRRGGRAGAVAGAVERPDPDLLPRHGRADPDARGRERGRGQGVRRTSWPRSHEDRRAGRAPGRGGSYRARPRSAPRVRRAAADGPHTIDREHHS